MLGRGQSSSVPLPDYLLAHKRVLEAERALAAATGDQYAVPLDLGFEPEAGVSAPLVLQNDSYTFLTFTAVRMLPDGTRQQSGNAIV